MKKFSLLLVLPFLGACALTEYPVITDEDQGPKVISTHTVNTAGLSYIKQKAQVAVIKPGNETREAVWFVQQDAKGNQTIYNYVNMGNLSDFSTVFHGTTYLNTETEGCWWVRAPNAASEGTSFNEIFNFETNESCSNRIGGATPPVRLAKFARSMEGGKDPGAGSSSAGTSSTSARPQSQFGVTLEQGFDVLNSLGSYATYGDWRADYGLEGYKLTTTPANIQVELVKDGAATQLMFDGVVAVIDVANARTILDTRTGNMADVLRAIADWVEANGQLATVRVTFAGVTGSTDAGLADAATWRNMADQLD